MSPDGSDRRALPGWLKIGILAVVLTSGIGWIRLKFDNSLEPLLPENSQARQTILFLRDSSFADTAVLWFRLKNDTAPISDLFAAADAAQKKLDPQLIKSVVQPPAESNMLDEGMALLDDAGELLNAADLADMQKAMAPQALKKRLRECYMQLVEPQGTFTAAIARHDPLGINVRILSRLSSLQAGLGYRVEIKDGRFMHPDGRQMLMILQTSATATSLASSRALANHFDQLAAEAPPDVEIIPICAQIHTEQNDELMQHDMRNAAIINTIAFIILFFVVSRDFRVGAVFLLPLATTVITIGWAALIHPNLSTMMIGLTVAMAGSAVDYGIFVYTAVTLGKNLQSELIRIRKPLLISHLTTLGVFIAFLFSKIPAFRQLGILTSISLVLSLLTALFLLPKVIRPGGKLSFLGRGMPLQRWGRLMVFPTIACSILLIASIFIAMHIRFDPDITRLDGVSARVKQNENDFTKTWSRSDNQLAMLVASGKTLEEAQALNDQVYAAVSPHFADGKFASVSSFWPSQATRNANLARWHAFWTKDQIAKFRDDLAKAGEPYGFSANAFEPFFQTLTSPPGDDQIRQIVQTVASNFSARSSDGDYQMLSYFDDTSDNLAIVRPLIANRPNVLIVSRGMLAQAFAESGSSETRVLVTVSLAFIIIALLVLTRSIRQSILIMLPAATGMLVMLAVLVLFGQGMSIVTIVAAILVLALGSDYGTFAAYAWDNREPVLGQGMSSVLLSFLTTLAGVGAMLIARHPALWLVGVTLTSGLLAGYLTALIMIPGIEYLRELSKPRQS
jgi:uncharacterized protein